MATDPRAVRTRERIHSAVLSLASSSSIAQVSVAELTRAARISRVTFYDHYKSSAEALVAALSPDLDDLRRQALRARRDTSTSPDEVRRVDTRNFADHILARRALYGTNLGRHAHGEIQDVLTAHIEHSLLHEIAPRPDTPAATDPGPAARFVARGMVGAVESWLSRPPGQDIPQSADDLARLLLALYPDWWR